MPAPKSIQRYKNYPAPYLKGLPTLQSGHFDNLKMNDDKTRVWLSRCTMEDGEPYDNKVTVEVFEGGQWVLLRTYQAPADAGRRKSYQDEKRSAPALTSGRAMVPTVGYDGLDKRRAIRASRAFLHSCGVSAKEIRPLSFSAKRHGGRRPYLVVTATGPAALIGSIAKRCALFL